MKKTIAILLVLVIGMVGVWAVTAELNLTTTVYEYNEMIITETSEVPGWTTFPGVTENTAEEGEPSDSEPTNADVGPLASSYTTTTRKYVDPYVAEVQNVGYLHTRTNNRLGYTVTVSATELSSTDGSETQTIDYIVRDASQDIFNTSSDTSAQNFLTITTGTGMRAESTSINVRLLSTGNSLSAGTYEGDITFTYTAN